MKHAIVKRYEAMGQGLYMVDQRQPQLVLIGSPVAYMTFSIKDFPQNDRKQIVKSYKSTVERSIPFGHGYMTCLWLFMPQTDSTAVSVFIKSENEQVTEFFKVILHDKQG